MPSPGLCRARSFTHTVRRRITTKLLLRSRHNRGVFFSSAYVPERRRNGRSRPRLDSRSPLPRPIEATSGFVHAASHRAGICTKDERIAAATGSGVRSVDGSPRGLAGGSRRAHRSSVSSRLAGSSTAGRPAHPRSLAYTPPHARGDRHPATGGGRVAPGAARVSISAVSAG